MSSEKKTRGHTSKKLFEESFNPIDAFKATGRLPSGKIMIGRMLFLTRRETEKTCLTRKEASKIVAKEFRIDWIDKNVYPMHKNRLAQKIEKDYDHFKNIRKNLNCDSKKKSDKFLSDAVTFANKLTQRAYDIRCTDIEYQKKMESDFGVKMTKDDEDFYMDNCHGPFKAFCSNTVPKNWERKRKRKLERQDTKNKKISRMESDNYEQIMINRNELIASLNDEINEANVSNDTLFQTPRQELFKNHRTFTEEAVEEIKKEPGIDKFPKVKVRMSRKRIDERIMRCAVQCLSETTASTREVCKVIKNVANMIVWF